MASGKSELCIFNRAEPQVVIENSHYEDIYPRNAIKGTSVNELEFDILGSDSHYLDLDRTVLSMKVKAVKADGTNYTTDDEYPIPSNYLMHCLFKSGSVSFNANKIEVIGDNYAQKAIIQTALAYSSDTKATFLETIGFGEESARKKLCTKSKTMSLVGPLPFDFFKQNRLLLPGVHVTVKLQRNENGIIFKSMKKKGTEKDDMEASNEKPIIYIEEAKLIVCHTKVDQSVQIGHQLGLEKQNAIYPQKKTKILTFSLANGTTSEYKENLFSDDRLPNLIIVTFQNTKQTTSDYTVYCSSFKHLNVSSLTLSRSVDFRETYVQDFEKDDYTETYYKSIIRNMDLMNKNMNNGISKTNFKSTYPFFTFVLAPDGDISQPQLPRQGNLKLDVKFSKALTEPAIMYVYGLFDSDLELTKNGTVVV